MAPLNILHVFRAPVGGLFRHVQDLAREQAARGHRVGLIADSSTGGTRATELLANLEPSLALGLMRVPMRRHAGPGDMGTLLRVMRRIAEVNADVVHGHGAKGGTYARLAFNQRRAVRAYTPHGGSLLFNNDNLAGRFYLGSERFLMLGGDLYLFESAFSADIFRSKIAAPHGLVRVVHNGVSRHEFEPVAVANDATDIVFLGELRQWIKGVDTLIDAIALLHRKGRPVTAILVGDGPDRSMLEAQVERLGLTQAISMPGAMPGRQALARGRLLVMASRAESLPYVVLEAAAASKPLVATRVGGIPEIYGPFADRLVPPGDAPAMAAAIECALDRPETTAEVTAGLHQRVASAFSVDTMVDGVLAAYGEALEKLRQKGRR
ncbi:glycosyltransferase family 4 protein [Microbacteriaceae bacterium K1510]|nr:glycosyltransferase family 4 protein [Microbacteriaceae bacterium K1510]